jgi:hypothetical protein
VAAVIEIVSPSQPRPAVIQSTSISANGGVSPCGGQVAAGSLPGESGFPNVSNAGLTQYDTDVIGHKRTSFSGNCDSPRQTHGTGMYEPATTECGVFRVTARMFCIRAQREQGCKGQKFSNCSVNEGHGFSRTTGSLGLMRALALKIRLCKRLWPTQTQKEMALPRMRRKAYLSG